MTYRKSLRLRKLAMAAPAGLIALAASGVANADKPVTWEDIQNDQASTDNVLRYGYGP